MPGITIPRVIKGQPGTLLDAERANELISIVERLANARVVLDPSITSDKSGISLSATDAVHRVGIRDIVPPIVGSAQ